MDPAAIIGILGGVIGTLTTVIAYFWRLHQADDAKRDAAAAAEIDRIIAERDRREAILIEERAEWRDRSISSETRLDRISNAFEKLANSPAPE